VRRRRRQSAWISISILGLVFASILASLSVITWRQSRVFESLAALDQVRRDISFAKAERAELDRHIRGFESRARISGVAAEHLGMHHPDASEIVFLTGVYR
jgi:cell division protein FtsL